MTALSEADRRSVEGMLLGVAPFAFNAVSVCVPGNPKGKKRPRFGRGHAYASRDQVAAERAVAFALAPHFKVPAHGSMALACVFYRDSFGRIDVDNMVKLICDAANKLCWRDDSQVKCIAARVELDRDNPRTLLSVAHVSSSMSRPSESARRCTKCDKPFTSCMPGAVFCSRGCSARSRGEDLRALVACGRCGVEFKRQTAAQRFCGDACRLAVLNKPGKPLPTCSVCGKTLSKHGYGRCRSCWAKDAKVHK